MTLTLTVNTKTPA